MKKLYLDCSFGACGDMLSSALFELLPDKEEALKQLNAMGIPGVVFEAESAQRGAVSGTHLRVLVNGEEEQVPARVPGHEPSGHPDEGRHHIHRTLREIEAIVEGLNASPAVRENAGQVYGLIAQAESAVHREPVAEVHFHEIGSMDALADIAAFSFLLERLAPQEVWASPVQTGTGSVMSAHGELPVPAPAAALILEGIPVFSDPAVKAELVTPTGAALLKRFVTHFGGMPVMTMEKTGYGMGSRNYGPLDFVRAVSGESAEAPDYSAAGQSSVVLEISCNVDDMTAEEISFAMTRIFEAGAFEVYTIPIGMKKSRPGTLLKAMCSETRKEAILEAVFKYTSTIGARITVTYSATLERRFFRLKTPYGNVMKKVSAGYGKTVEKYEFKDLSRLAKEQNVSLSAMRQMLEESERNGTAVRRAVDPKTQGKSGGQE